MWKKLVKQFNLNDSYISMGLGLLVVLITGILLFNYFQNKKVKPNIAETGEQISEEQESQTSLTNLPKTHLVTENENLWIIAEKYYNSGYNWIDIAKANNLSNANLIEVGQELTIPEITPILIQTQEETTKIVGSELKSYTVKSGDNLWNIAVKIYNNGYRWVDIAKANNLANPDIIHSGNILILPN